MDIIEFFTDVKELMKKHSISKIVPSGECRENKIELDNEKDIVHICGFTFKGNFDHDQLEEILIENKADYDRY